MKNLIDILEFISKDTIYEKLDIDKVKIEYAPEDLFKALSLKNAKMIFQSSAKRADISGERSYKCYEGYFSNFHKPMRLFIFNDGIVIFMFDNDFINPVDAQYAIWLNLNTEDFRNFKKELMLPIDAVMKNSKRIVKNLDTLYSNNNKIMRPIDWSNWEQIG